MLKTVAAVIVGEVEPFGIGVASEVFGVDRTDDGLPAFDFRICGERAAEPIRSRLGMQLVPEYGLDALEDADVVAIPGTQVSSAYPRRVLDAVCAAKERGATVLSMCTGAFILGAAGLLDDRPCTTHWKYVTELARQYPLARIDPDVLFVDDGDLITSAGTGAGIDACLHLIRRELGTAAAVTMARRMVVPPQREGGQRQYIEQPVPESECDSLQPVLDWVIDHVAEPHTVASMARRAQMSARTFARRFLAETGTTPGRWLTVQRVARARRLLEDSDLPVDEVATGAGFGSAALLRHHFHRSVGVSPTTYRTTFGT